MKTGSVLIVCLWALFFLGALAVSVGTRAAASIRLAEHIKVSSALDHIACSGVARAVAAIRSGNEEILMGPGSEYWSRENQTVEGGIFTVTTSGVFDGKQSVTNFGVACETSRTNINNMAQISSLLEKMADRVTAARLKESIREYRVAKKALTSGLSNGRFESIYELLLVDGMTEELFEAMKPVITVFDRDCFGGISRARLSGYSSGDGQYSPQQEIIFVFNRKEDKIVFWEQ